MLLPHEPRVLLAALDAPDDSHHRRLLAERPTALRVGNRWIVYFDRYREHRYGALASIDLKTWGDVTSQLVMPPGIRHGTAFRVPANDAERLLAHDGR